MKISILRTFPVLLFISLILSCSDMGQDNAENNAEKAASADKPRLEQSAAQQAFLPFEVLSVIEGRYEQGPALAVTLSVPIDPTQDLSRLMQVSVKEPDGGLDSVRGSWILGPASQEAFFTRIEPETTYQVHISRRLRSADQQELGKSHTSEVKTQEIESMLAFADSGYVMVDDIARGLPVVTVNISSVNVDYYRLSVEALRDFYSQSMHYKEQGEWQIASNTRNATLVHSARYDLKPPRNRVHRVNLPVRSVKELSPPGVYMAVMRPPSAYNERYKVTLFVQTDLGLHLRKYPQTWDLMVKSIKTALPVAGAKVAVINNKGTFLAQMMTDDAGFATLPAFGSKDRPAVLLVQSDKDVNVLSLNRLALDLSEFETGKQTAFQQTAFFYGPRNLYRPGETLKLNLLLRDAAGKFTSELSGLAPETQIISPSGKVMKEFVWRPEGQGYYHLNWPIAAQAMRGNWRVRVGLPGASQQYQFKVEDFQPETVTMTLTHPADPDLPLVADDEEHPIVVEAAYLYGSPARRNKLLGWNQAWPSVQPFRLLPGVKEPSTAASVLDKRLGQYIFGQPHDTDAVARSDLPEAFTGKEGTLRYRIHSRWQGLNSAMMVLHEITLLETSGRPVTRRTALVTWPRDKQMLGVHLVGTEEQQLRHDRPVRVGADASLPINIVKVNMAGEPQAAPRVKVTLLREKRDYFWVRNNQRGWHWQSRSRWLKMFEKNLALDASPEPASLSLPIRKGDYRLEIAETGTDNMTQVPLTTGFYGHGDDASNKPDRIEVNPDRESYRPGEVARMQIVPPAAGIVRVMVESDRALWRRSQFVPVTGAVVEIPIASDWQTSDLYVSALLFQPGESHAAKTNQATPIRAIGLVPLVLDHADRHLAVSLETREEWQSETDVTVTARIDGIGSQTEETWVTLAVVDEGVLAVEGYQTPDPIAHVFGQKRYQVNIQDVYHQLIVATDGGFARQRFGGDQLSLSMMRAKEPEAGQRFIHLDKLFSIFTERVKVDAEGKAVFNLTLPDYVGEARIMALAFNDRQLGHGEQQVKVKSPLIHRLEQPGYLAMTDRSQAVTRLQNLTGRELNLDLHASVSGPISLVGDKQKSLVLAPDEQHTWTLPLLAGKAVGPADLAVVIKSADGNIQSEQKKRLWVSSAFPAITRRERIALDPGKQHSFSTDTSGLLASTLSGSLNLSGQLPLDMSRHAKALLNYPYGCTEQAISRAWLWLKGPDRLHALLVSQPDVDQSTPPVSQDMTVEVQKRVNDAVLALLDRQKPNGSFPLWERNGSEAPWVSVYATDFLIQAAKQGFAVPEQSLKKARDRLQYYLRQQGHLWMVNHYLEDSGHYGIATKAYAAWVLASENRAGLSDIRRLVEQELHDASSPLPVAHLAAALKLQGDVQGAKALWARLSEHDRAEGHLGDYGSGVRDHAVLVQLGLDHGLDWSQWMVKLMEALHLNQWLNTQDHARLYALGTSLEQHSPDGTPWFAELASGNRPPLSLTDREDKTLPIKAGDLVRGMTLRHLDSGGADSGGADTPLYASFSLTAFPEQGPDIKQPPLDDHIRVEKRYRDRKGERLDISQLKIGQTVLVEIRVQALHRHVPDALLVDLLPPGLRIENPNLIQNVYEELPVGQMKIDGQSFGSLLQFQAGEYHTAHQRDRFIASGTFRKGQVVQLFYVARATIPGRYQLAPTQVESMYQPETRGSSAGLAPMVILP